MSDFYDRVNEKRKQKGKNKSQMLKDLNLSSNTFVNWEKRGTIPSGDILYNLADYLGTTPEYLLYGIEQESEPKQSKPYERLVSSAPTQHQSDPEELFDNLYHSLTTEQREKVISFMQNMKDNPDIW